MRTVAILTACLILSACGRRDNEPGPGGVTLGEARALDEAAQMLEERRLPPQQLRSGGSPDNPAAEKTAAGE